jgi:hypothetical protein
MHPGHTCGGGVLAGHGSSMAGACIQGTLAAVGCWQGTVPAWQGHASRAHLLRWGAGRARVAKLCRVVCVVVRDGIFLRPWHSCCHTELVRTLSGL